MPLTWREQRALDEIAQSLREEDPGLTSNLATASVWLRLPIRKYLVYVGIWIGWAFMIGGFASARGVISGGVITGFYGLIILVSCTVIVLRRKSRLPRHDLKLKSGR